MSSEVGGKLLFTFSGSSPSLCAYETATAYDLTGRSVYVDVPEAAIAGGPGIAFRVVDEDLDGIEARAIDPSALQVASLQGDIPGGPTGAASARFWRVAESAGELVLSTSDDGIGWMDITSVSAAAVGMDVTAIHVELHASNGLNGLPGVLSSNGYNAP